MADADDEYCTALFTQFNTWLDSLLTTLARVLPDAAVVPVMHAAVSGVVAARPGAILPKYASQTEPYSDLITSRDARFFTEACANIEYLSRLPIGERWAVLTDMVRCEIWDHVVTLENICAHFLRHQRAQQPAAMQPAAMQQVVMAMVGQMLPIVMGASKQSEATTKQQLTAVIDSPALGPALHSLAARGQTLREIMGAAGPHAPVGAMAMVSRLLGDADLDARLDVAQLQTLLVDSLYRFLTSGLGEGNEDGLLGLLQDPTMAGLVSGIAGLPLDAAQQDPFAPRPK